MKDDGTACSQQNLVVLVLPVLYTAYSQVVGGFDLTSLRNDPPMPYIIRPCLVRFGLTEIGDPTQQYTSGHPSLKGMIYGLAAALPHHGGGHNTYSVVEAGDIMIYLFLFLDFDRISLRNWVKVSNQYCTVWAVLGR